MGRCSRGNDCGQRRSKPGGGRGAGRRHSPARGQHARRWHHRDCGSRRRLRRESIQCRAADLSALEGRRKSGFIDQLYAAYRPLPALSGSPSSKSEASGFAPFSDVVLRISRDVVASTNATVARPAWRPCSWRYSRQSKRDVQDLGLPFRTHPQSAVLE